MLEFFRNIQKFLKAILGKKADMKTYAGRINICLGCTWNIQKKNRNYCRECGCPKTVFWPFSELKTKCGYLNAECPRKKWSS